MRAVMCRAWGPIDDLIVEDVAPPTPGRGQVVIDVHATGVNYADSIMVAGRYQTRPTLPFSPGLEAAGVVTQCGDGVTRYKPGDHVMAILAYGGFAERAAADEVETFAIPSTMPFDEAGAFPIAYISSHVAIRWQGRLEPGEMLLVLGAAGGVGLTAVEIGKAMGARVIAAASTAEKLAAAQERGADDVVNYVEEKLTDRVMTLTNGKGADVCFDPVGGDLFDSALSSLGWGGRILLIGFVAGVPQIPANRLLVKHRAALGSSLRYFRWHAPDKLLRSVEELVRWYGEGKLRPLVTHRLPLEQSVEAIRLLTDRKAHGKVVVLVWDELERGDRRCIVLTGAGDHAFSAGADISGDLSARAETAKVLSRALLKTDAYSKPIVAAVNGDCVGGGLELLLSTDIRAAAPHARFGLPEVRWSIYPFGGATVKLIQQVGHVHAMNLLLTGKLIDASEGARLGLVN